MHLLIEISILCCIIGQLLSFGEDGYLRIGENVCDKHLTEEKFVQYMECVKIGPDYKVQQLRKQCFASIDMKYDMNADYNYNTYKQYCKVNTESFNCNENVKNSTEYAEIGKNYRTLVEQQKKCFEKMSEN